MNRSQRRAAHNLTPATLNRLFRATCTDCDSHDLDWFPATELPFKVWRDQADEALDLLAQLEDTAGCEAWICLNCTHFGVMGSWARA